MSLNNKTIFRSLACLIILFIGGCGQSKYQVGEYLSWINDPGNGLIKVKYVNSIKLTVKYLPAQYLAYLEFKDSQNVEDSVKVGLVDLYSKSRTFLLSIGPDDRETNGRDIMFANVSNYQEYAERTLTMNFDMSELISIATDAGEFKPVLSTMENTYGLTNHRNIYVVFSPTETQKELTDSEQLDLSYNDELFNTGINHFVFKKKNIDAVPELIF